MSHTLGLVANMPEPSGTLELIARADALGLSTAWLITGGTAPDPLVMFAAAASRSPRIQLGTAILPIWPRHPLAVAQSVLALNTIAPSRLRLGLGPGGAGNEHIYGIPYGKPLGHLREYLAILRTIFTSGQVDFDGKHYHAHARLGATNQPALTLQVPLLTSALQRGSFHFGGELADGVLTWICPLAYVRSVGLPALREGAHSAGRAAPPLIVHVPIVIHANAEEVRAAVRAQYGFYTRLPYYAAMFAAAGFPEASESGWSDRMIDATVVHGDEATVRQRLEEFYDAGVDEVMAQVAPAGADRAASLARTLEGLASFVRR
jgi:F420-dependent oxidoreductase-like protein